MKLSATYKFTPYLYVLPVILILVILMLIPIINTVYFSFFDNAIVSTDPNYVGFSNYYDLFTDPSFYSTIWNTIEFTVLSVLGHLFLGLLFASLLNRPLNPIVLGIFRVLLIMPWIFTAVVVCSNWQLLLNPLGILNYIFKSLNLIDEWVDWLGNENYAMITLIVVSWWRGYPFLMVSFLASMQSIPYSLNEAAIVDGANSRQVFFNITIPYIMPVIKSVCLLDTIWTFRLFPLVWLLTGGGPGRETEVLSTYVYRTAFVSFEFSQASAIAVVLLIITSVFTVFYLHLEKQAE